MVVDGDQQLCRPVNVNGGTLAANGDITSASSVTVNAGGILGGNGVVGATIINGGGLAPGSSIGTLTVQGNLVFTMAASYMVEMSGSTADKTVVTGMATLAGTVRLSPAASFSFNTPVTILTAAGFGGTTFDAVAAPTGIAGSLIYSATSVQLSLASGLGQIAGLYLSARSSDCARYRFQRRRWRQCRLRLDLRRQRSLESDAGLRRGRNRIAADHIRSTNLFIGVMTDPFMAGRRGNTPGAVPFADESGSSDAYAAAGRKRTGGEREAYGMMTKAAPHAPGFGSRWDAWAAGFGGGQTSDGNAALGSQHDNQPDRRVRRGRRLLAVAAYCGRFRPGRRRHQLLRRQWFGEADGPIRFRPAHSCVTP